MTTKRAEAMRKQMAEAAERLENREATQGAPPSRLDIPAVAIQTKRLSESVYERLDAYKAESERLRAKLDAIDTLGPTLQIDPRLVDVQGFNRLPSSLDPKTDPDFARLCENIRVFGGNKQPAMVRPSPTSPDRYELVFGERRMRACQLMDVPFTAIVSEMDDNELLLLRELENVGRKDKSLIERAFSLSNLPERLAYGTRDELLASLKISDTTFRRLRRIAAVPLAIWSSIPQAHTTSAREAQAVYMAYEDNPQGVMARAETLKPDVSHADAVRHLSKDAEEQASTTPRKPLTRKGNKVKLSLNLSSRKAADEFERELKALLLRLGITPGEDTENGDAD